MITLSQIMPLYYGALAVIIAFSFYLLFADFSLRVVSFLLYAISFLLWQFLQHGFNFLSSPLLHADANSLFSNLSQSLTLIFSFYFFIIFFKDRVHKALYSFLHLLALISISSIALLWFRPNLFQLYKDQVHISIILFYLSISILYGNRTHGIKGGGIYFAISWLLLVLGQLVSIVQIDSELFGSLLFDFVFLFFSSVHLMFALISVVRKGTSVQISSRVKTASLVQVQQSDNEVIVPKVIIKQIEKKDEVAEFVEEKMGLKTPLEKTSKTKLTVMEIHLHYTLDNSADELEVHNFLNSYLSKVNDIIKENSGIIDKYDEEKIIALFAHNSDSILEAIKEMAYQLRSNNEANESDENKKISQTIGVHYGTAILGSLGVSDNRFDFHAFGESLHIPRSLEKLTRIYGTSVLLSGSFINNLEANLKEIRRIDTIRLSKSLPPEDIYEYFGNASPDEIEAKMKTLPVLRSALAFYQSGNFVSAREAYEECLKIYPDDFVASVFIRRCNYLTENPPGLNWSGLATLRQLS